MKKKIIIALAMNIFVLILTGMYTVYDDLFPMAEKFDYPDYSLVESITVSKRGESIPLSQEDCKILYEYISHARPTRKMSAHETPSVAPFYTVDIESDDLYYFNCGYIYKEHGKVYFEISYVGIYALDSDALSYIEKYDI